MSARAPRARWLLRVALTVVCCGAIGASLVAYESKRSFHAAAKRAYRLQSPERTEALLQRARRLNPDSEVDVNLVLTVPRLRPRGEAILRTALSREPDNVRLWLVLARVQDAAGSTQDARVSYARARGLDPFLPALTATAPDER